MTKLCPRGKAAAKRKFKVYPSAHANAYASKICAGKIKDPSGVKRKDFRGSKAEGGLMEATSRLKRQGLKAGGGPRAGRPVSRLEEQKRREKRRKLGPAGRGKRKEDSSVTLGKFMKAKVSGLEESAKKGGMRADRAFEKFRRPEEAKKAALRGDFSKKGNIKDAAYYKSIGLTGKRGDKAVESFFKPMKFNKGGRAGYRKGGGVCLRGMNRDAIGKNSQCHGKEWT